MKWKDKARKVLGVSTVIGVILMVAVSVALAAAVYVYVSSTLVGKEEIPPSIVFLQLGDSDSLTITSVGEPVDATKFNITFKDIDGTVKTYGYVVDTDGDGYIEGGDLIKPENPSALTPGEVYIVTVFYGNTMVGETTFSFYSTSSGNSWTKMRPIIISGSSIDLTSYQIKLILNHDSDMQPDFDDLRFYDEDGNELSYWVESYTPSGSAIVWVKVPSIPTSGTTIYMYYGNPSAQSKSDVDATFIRVIDGLVACWHFDEASGTIAYDTSGNDNDGLIYGGATWTTGKYGEALYFDGYDDYVDCGSDYTSISTEFTVELWMKTSDTTKKGTPVSYATTNPNYGNEILLYNYKGFATCIGGSKKWTGVSANDGSWHHIVWVWRSSDGNIKLYKDNLVAYQGTLQAGYVINHGTDRRLILAQEQDTVGDAFQSYQAFKGIMDEVRIYNRYLSPDEIADLYNYYGYTTENYPGKVLVKKYATPEPTAVIGDERQVG